VSHSCQTNGAKLRKKAKKKEKEKEKLTNPI
jgi:hypothetical protein